MGKFLLKLPGKEVQHVTRKKALLWRGGIEAIIGLLHGSIGGLTFASDFRLASHRVAVEEVDEHDKGCRLADRIGEVVAMREEGQTLWRGTIDGQVLRLHVLSLLLKNNNKNKKIFLHHKDNLKCFSCVCDIFSFIDYG